MKDKIVQEWFERGKRDLESAKLIYVQKGYFDEVVFLIHQAIEKYLKGYLIFHGWKLKKIHDIETLLVEAMKYDQSFMEFLDLGRKITPSTTKIGIPLDHLLKFQKKRQKR